MTTRWLAAGIWAAVAILGLSTQASAQTGQLFGYAIVDETGTNEPDPFPSTGAGPILGAGSISTLSYPSDGSGTGTVVGNVTKNFGSPKTRWSITFNNTSGSAQSYDLTFSFGRDAAFQELYFKQLSFGYTTDSTGIFYTVLRGTTVIDGGNGTGASSGNDNGNISASNNAWLSTSTVPLKIGEPGNPLDLPINPDSVIFLTPETWTLRFTLPAGASFTISNIEITGRSVIPEPAMALLAGAPLIGAVWMLRRRKVTSASETYAETDADAPRA